MCLFMFFWSLKLDRFFATNSHVRIDSQERKLREAQHALQIAQSAKGWVKKGI